MGQAAAMSVCRTLVTRGIFNDQFTIYNQFAMSQFSNKYNLEERTIEFGGDIILFCKSLRKDVVSIPIISQTVRSGTSIGANYCEANNASSRKDFQNKIFICKKESQETKYWLRMFLKYFPEKQEEINILLKEAQELTMIFQKIVSSLRGDNKQ